MADQLLINLNHSFSTQPSNARALMKQNTCRQNRAATCHMTSKQNAA
jgi:hypothetical protein